MKKLKHLPVLFAPVLALGLGGVAPMGGDGEEIELDEAEVFIEYNSTDEDFGIQFFWDGEPWVRMKAQGPDGRTVLKVRSSRNLAMQGLTEGFFESAEPSADDLPMDEFLERFPTGPYEYEGTTLEGDEIEGETEFTHVLPAPPEKLSPADGDVVSSDLPLVVGFEAVTTDMDGNDLEPELYELIVETEGDILRVFTVILPGDAASPSATVPPEFLTPGTDFKFEVIVQEESGNRTIAETEFKTL